MGYESPLIHGRSSWADGRTPAELVEKIQDDNDCVLPLRGMACGRRNQVIDENWVTFNRDPVGVCYGDSGAPTLFNGRVVAVASDGALDCVSADNRARVDSKDVRNWIKSQIDLRFPF